MDHVGMQEEPGVEDGERRVNKRLERLVPWRPHRRYADVGELAGARITAASDDDDFQLVVQSGQARIEMLAMGLDAAHDIRNAAKTDGADSHGPSLRCGAGLNEEQ